MTKRNYDTWSKEELVREVEKLDKKLKKNYGLVWEDKLEDVATLCKEKLPILDEDAKKEIKTDRNKPINILIEGDNYHALSVLNYTHKGRIDVIYIDPPYNTGQKDFKYNDLYVDLEDAYRHSKWVAFMEKRLKLARNLMKKTGIIFISIDDNELYQLKLLMDSVFNERNFIGNFIWKSKIGGGNDNKHFVTEHEYILVYSRDVDSLPTLFERTTDEYKSKFKLKDKYFATRGGYYIDSLYKSGIDSNRPNLRYSIKAPGGKAVWPPTIWRLSKEEFYRRLKNDEIVFKKDKSGNWKIYTKTYYITENGERQKKPRSIFDYTFGGTRQGNDEIQTMFGELVFKYPKNVDLMKYILGLHQNRNAITLDFMAGTGTTAHATLRLNEEDGGNRQFILCTNNENNICTDICYPRIKKVIEGYKDSKKEEIEGLGGNLKYFKTDFVDAKPTDRNKKKLVDKSTEMLCLKEDCFDEVKKGSDFKIFKNSQNKYLGIVYDDDGIERFKKEAKNMKEKFVVYVFSLDESAREEEFEDIADIVQLKPIPAVILNVYKRIFK